MINVRFITKGSPFGLAYSPGEAGVLPVIQAEELKRLGVVEIIQDFSDLPEGIPARDLLIENGFTLLEDIRSTDDLTELNGIGKALNKKIHDFVDDL